MQLQIINSTSSNPSIEHDCDMDTDTAHASGAGCKGRHIPGSVVSRRARQGRLRLKAGLPGKARGLGSDEHAVLVHCNAVLV